MMIRPDNLQSGDSVAIVATARKVIREELTPAIKTLKQWGLKPILGNSIGLTDNQFAGTDQQRAEDVQQQLDDPAIKAIWCARGGYGTVRILDQLDFSNFKKCPKWMIGYSDITVLLIHLNTLGYMSLHAQMPVQIEEKSTESAESLRRVLFGEPLQYQWKSTSLNRFGAAEGELVGGNLSVLYSLCGSRSIPDMNGKILFLEDLDEYLYHIDRMMQNLKRNTWFENLKGLIIGGMTEMNDNTIPFGKTAKQIIAETIKTYDFPVAFDFPAGHITDNRSLVFGQKVKLRVGKEKSMLL